MIKSQFSMLTPLFSAWVFICENMYEEGEKMRKCLSLLSPISWSIRKDLPVPVGCTAATLLVVRKRRRMLE